MTPAKIAHAMAEQVEREKAVERTDAPVRTQHAIGTQELPISLVRADGGTQSRAELSSEIIGEYASLMEDGTLFPAVTVFYDGETHWLADGFHRIAAAKTLEYQRIYVDVKQGTRRDAVLYSVSANAAHGLRRTDADKKRAVALLLEDDEWSQWSNREIAKRCKVSHTYVNQLRSASGNSFPDRRKTTRNGATYTMDTAKIGKTIVEARQDARVQALKSALTNAPDLIVQFVQKHNIDDAEKVLLLKQGWQDKRQWCEELLTSDYIQPGDEREAVHAIAPILEWRNAIDTRQRAHLQIIRDQPISQPVQIKSSVGGGFEIVTRLHASDRPTALMFAARLQDLIQELQS